MAAYRTQRLFDQLITWAPVLMLGGLAALTYWLDAQIQTPPLRIDGSSRHDPDLFVSNLRGVSFDAEGRPRQVLSAKRAQHYPDDESVSLLEPSLILTDPGRPKLSVRADQGSVAGDRETMVLEGNVRAVREAQPAAANGPTAEGPATLSTEFLRVVPKKGLAETDRPVTIEEPRGIIHSVGMKLDNDAKTLKLKSGVRGTIQPGSLPK
jgi:lipopolysaccharide export system protein LptC